MESNLATSCAQDKTMANINMDTEPDSIVDAIQILSDITKQIRAVEQRLNQQRVDAAVLLVELSTLHDPVERDEYAVMMQTSQTVAEIISNSKMNWDQTSQNLSSAFPNQTAETFIEEYEAEKPGLFQAAENDEKLKQPEFSHLHEQMEIDSATSKIEEHYVENHPGNHLNPADDENVSYSVESTSKFQDSDDSPHEKESEETDQQHERECEGMGNPHEGEFEGIGNSHEGEPKDTGGSHDEFEATTGGGLERDDGPQQVLSEGSDIPIINEVITVRQ